MPDIALLDQDTIDQIAAGEVVERPSSVVKELMENSIDAGAGALTAEIKDGGISLIRVTDNGCGISEDQIATAFLPHATSKIKNASDLLTVSSLGFRGEALSSIAAVSRVEAITKTCGELTGCRYQIHGGKEISMEEVGAPDGTTIVVRDLFYNTPARQKFLKSPRTEGSYISSLTEKLALSRPNVSVRFIQNGRICLHTSGNNNIKDLIYMIFGRETAENLIAVHSESGDMRLTGYIGGPAISRGNRAYENCFVNGRYVRNDLICRAVEDGFSSYMMQHRYPFAVLYLEIEPEFFDVNVHPSKMELKFRDGDEVYSLISSAVKDSLSEREHIRRISFDEPAGMQNNASRDPGRGPEPFEEKRAELLKEDLSYAAQEKGSQAANEAINSAGSQAEPFRQTELFENRLLTKRARDEYRFIGQVFDTYWLIQYGDELMMIDQHAAHEKVIYERLLKDFSEKKVYGQQLSPPMLITLNMREEETLIRYRKRFEDLGFETEHFGGREYAVTSVPANLYGAGERGFFTELIDSLSGDVSKESDGMILERLASMSCKAAVKGNNRLSVPEAEALIDELLTLDNPYACPHGRPTIISMSRRELEKRFKRIV